MEPRAGVSRGRAASDAQLEDQRHPARSSDTPRTLPPSSCTTRPFIERRQSLKAGTAQALQTRLPQNALARPVGLCCGGPAAGDASPGVARGWASCSAARAAARRCRRPWPRAMLPRSSRCARAASRGDRWPTAGAAGSRLPTTHQTCRSRPGSAPITRLAEVAPAGAQIVRIRPEAVFYQPHKHSRTTVAQAAGAQTRCPCACRQGLVASCQAGVRVQAAGLGCGRCPGRSRQAGLGPPARLSLVLDLQSGETW